MILIGKQISSVSLVIAALSVLFVAVFWGWNRLQTDFAYQNIASEPNHLFVGGSDGYAIFRIPSLSVITAGSTLADGTLDRAKLRSVVFANAEEKSWLEKLLHPQIGAEVYRQLEAAPGPYVLFVSPLLIEAGQHAICDRIVVVDVPEEIQLARTVARDDNRTV